MIELRAYVLFVLDDSLLFVVKDESFVHNFHCEEATIEQVADEVHL
jgi:hypothetical protein